MIDEEQLRRRQAASQRAFYRAMASGSPGASLLELQGVQATLVPVREWFSIFNSVFYDDPGDLERAHAGPDPCLRRGRHQGLDGMGAAG